MREMIWSKYNFLVELEEGRYVLYNSYTNNLVELTVEDWEKIKLIKEGNRIIDKDLIDELIEECILVEDDELIYQKVKLSRLNTRFRSDIIHLTIVPTMGCNFACPYCFEKDVHDRKTMSAEIQDGVIEFIKKYQNLHYLSIDWYGGEPLLAFNVIENIMNKINTLNIESFHSSIVTNGYLLNESIINKFKELGIKRMQLTIDGLKDTHNQRRPHKTQKDSFETIINNLILTSQLYPELEVHVRVNIDKDNSEEFFMLNEYLRKIINSTNIYAYPAYITDYNSCNTGFCLLNRLDQADFALKNGDKYPFDRFYYPRTRINECTARFANSFVIGPEGELYRCWCDVGESSKICGSIYEGVTNADVHTKYMTYEDPLFDTQCKECSYFPICNGGCVLRRINNKGNNNLDLCTIQKGRIEDFIKLLVRNSSI